MPKVHLSEPFTKLLISLWECHPCLYDSKDQGYRNQFKKQRARDFIADALQKKNFTVPGNYLFMVKGIDLHKKFLKERSCQTLIIIFVYFLQKEYG